MKQLPISNDEIYLTRAFQLAQCGRFTTSPNPNVGCVIVRNGYIIGEGYHMKAGGAHAEPQALNIAGNAAQGATAYVTLEPCSHHGNTSPCADMLIKAGIKRVVIAMLDPNPKVSGKGLHRLQSAGLQVTYNLMLSEAEQLNQGFIKRMRTGLPYVRLKLAISLDGRTAMHSGESHWITSIESRRDVQKLRAESDAILSTANTVLIDNPLLNVRWSLLSDNIKNIYPKSQLRQPIRVIVDSKNRIMPSHPFFKSNGETWLIRAYPDCNVWPLSIKQIIIPSALNQKNIVQINLIKLMIKLGLNEINYLLIEAGANFSGALLNYELVDELIIYQSTKLLGTYTKPLCVLKKLKNISEALTLNLLDLRKIGPDIYLRLKPSKIFGMNHI